MEVIEKILLLGGSATSVLEISWRVSEQKKTEDQRDRKKVVEECLSCCLWLALFKSPWTWSHR